VVPTSNAAVSAVAALLGIDLTGINVPIGLSCSPITVIGNNWYAISSVCIGFNSISSLAAALPSTATLPMRSGVRSV
jgi:hypothetical protein